MGKMIRCQTIKRASYVCLSDYEDYDPRMAVDGGKYAYYIHFHRNNGAWRVSYSTSSNFPYNDCTGSFSDDWSTEYEYIRTNELRRRIREFLESNPMYPGLHVCELYGDKGLVMKTTNH